MTRPRKSLISLSDTPYYHCVSRCLRRAYLCGYDRFTQKSFEHRRDWLEVKLLTLADIFLIKLCAYAVMSNHYHVVLHIREDIASDWSEHEVIQRWHKLFNGTLFFTQFEKHFQSWVSHEHIGRAFTKTVQRGRKTPLRIHKE